MNRTFIFLLIIILSFDIRSQTTEFYSIHKEQSEFFSQMGKIPALDYDSLNPDTFCTAEFFGGTLVERRVFGYFPYWAGSNYLNYQWNLLSDLCYFSYEVDPASGHPSSINDWENSPAIDTALSKGLKVHLCVTLFSEHALFFNSSSSQQTLITNIIDLIQQRGAHGVNIDFEALPLANGNDLTDFIIELSNQLHDTNPEYEVSIAAPAVNWSGTFNIPALNQYVDFFMVMGYDYYWNGSSQAGPVSPLYTMTGNYDYNFSKTVSYYQTQGVSSSDIIMGVPYYARQWPTQGQYAPSNTTGTGTACTYRYVKMNSSGNYSTENRQFEPNSRSSYYSFGSVGWNQCFLDEVYSLGEKYDIVNRRNLAGIGIWALGYDDGYADLWDLISVKFSDLQDVPESDTIYDTGGPAFNYYNDENYSYTIEVPEQKKIRLQFEFLDIEPGYDSLWIFEGEGLTGQLLGVWSGNESPGTLFSSGNHLTLKVTSDAAITGQGWEAVYQALPSSSVTENSNHPTTGQFNIYPNPASRILHIKPLGATSIIVSVKLFTLTGQAIIPDLLSFDNKNNGNETILDLSLLNRGFYFLQVTATNGEWIGKFILK